MDWQLLLVSSFRGKLVARHFRTFATLSANCRRTTFADDAAGESKRIVLGSRWLGGTLHAEAGRSCTVRRRLIGVRGRIYDRLGGDVPPHPTDSCYSDLATQDKKGEWRGKHRVLCRCWPTFAEPLTTEEAVR